MIIVRNDLSEKLNYLTILAEEQNITRAAARLFVSQPALTAYLNRLEAELGTKLFDRSKTPIKITPAGAYYISEMEKISAQQDRLQHELKQIDFDPEMKLNLSLIHISISSRHTPRRKSSRERPDSFSTSAHSVCVALVS